MTLSLQTLPRATEYGMRAISAANTLNPAFGGPIQRIGRKGSRFALDVSVPALAQRCAGVELVADLVRGETEMVALPVPEDMPAEPYGTVLVAGGAQAGSTLSVDGLTPGVVVRKGKFFSVSVSGQRYVYIVTAETVADALGAADLPIWPMLRASPADNAAVELSTPMIEGFVQPGQEWSISRLKAIGLRFTIEERA